MSDKLKGNQHSGITSIDTVQFIRILVTCDRNYLLVNRVPSKFAVKNYSAGGLYYIVVEFVMKVISSTLKPFGLVTMKLHFPD